MRGNGHDGEVRQQATTYLSDMGSALSLLRLEEIEAGLTLLRKARRRAGSVYVFGNGGSASTASHLAVDLGRVGEPGSAKRMRVVALTDNVPWLTAASNDGSYHDCFVEPLRHYLRPGDLVIGISASGDSENVVRAFELAREVGADRLALIGFDGGRLSRLATQRIWVDSYDYGIVESVHVLVMHLLVHLLSGQEPVTGDERGAPELRRERVEAITGSPLARD